jgi:hypothetical protein
MGRLTTEQVHTGSTDRVGSPRDLDRVGWPRNDFPAGGATQLSPLWDVAASLRGSRRLNTFRALEDDVDAATPVDAENAPTGVWKSRKEREIPTSGHIDHLLCMKKKED